MEKRIYCAVALLALAGCANHPAPAEQLRLTEQALLQARSAGATQQTPELALAEQKLASAHAAMGKKRHKAARVLAEQAELDARLAEARLLNEESQAQRDELTQRIARLRQQLGAQQ